MTNPYMLPAGNVQIAFSGGRTSGYLLHEILEANGGLPADRCVVSFQNTGREMPATLDYVQELGERWNVPIVWLEYRGAKPLFEVVSHNSASRNGEPFDQLIARKQAVPNIFKKWCSAELKTLTAKRYLVAQGWRKWTSAIGFRHDEEHRHPYVDKRITAWTPLRAAGITRHDVVRFWMRQPFNLRLPVVRGKTIGGNCDGCFLKSEAFIASLAVDHPERAAWWERHEAERGNTFSDRYSRAELRNFMSRQGTLALSTEGALCQTDEGECTA
jgi:3'-phosphoadenosine 5'-phosphosulfate sulfotransferase (PAPS reductase)/FAD synthetase